MCISVCLNYMYDKHTMQHAYSTYSTCTCSSAGTGSCFDEIEVATQVSEQVLVYDWTIDRVEDGALKLDAALVG